MSTGDNYIGSVVSAIQASPDWASTAIFITYDDCGCFFDYVNPLKYNSSWGIRVPMVIVSPFAKLGYTDSTPTTFAGTLAFVEHVFRLAPLNSTDAGAFDYRNAFCYQPTVTGCVAAGVQPLPLTSQQPTPLSPAQRSAQIASASDDTLVHLLPVDPRQGRPTPTCRRYFHLLPLSSEVRASTCLSTSLGLRQGLDLSREDGLGPRKAPTASLSQEGNFRGIGRVRERP